MKNQLYLVIGIIVNNVGWAFVCNGYYQQKMISGITEGFPFVWHPSLVYYIAIIPAIIGIGFIVHACRDKIEPKKKKKNEHTRVQKANRK